MEKATLYLHEAFTVGSVPKNIYGSFIEHIGRAVYTGFFEPEHKFADEEGYRQDVIQAIKNLGVSIVRYPGGNFVSAYDFKNGIGKNRVKQLDLAWKQIEPNTVGVDEFMSFAKKCGFEAMMCVNLGTGSAKEAGELVEYCNHKGGGYWSELRKENGMEQPYGIKYWCLGNEMDGDWQINSMTAEQYAKKAMDAAKIMKAVDPNIKLIACGSSNNFIATYPEWDIKVLDGLYDYVDYLSVHAYYYTDDADEDLDSYLASYKDFRKTLDTIHSVCNFVKAKHRGSKDIKLSVDEWNVWRHYQGEIGKDDWTVAPERLECTYTMIDAVCFTSLLCTLLNRVDYIDIACLAQLINVLAPIKTQPGGEVLLQTIYYPFLYASRFFKGVVLEQKCLCPKRQSSRYGTYDSVVTSAAIDGNTLCVIAVNNDLEKEFDFEPVFGKKISLRNHYLMSSENPLDFNSFDCPDKVVMREKESGDKGILPPLSVNFLIYEISER
jgi:alpha-N-arabinofuranosidase